MLRKLSGLLNPEIVIGFLTASVFWVGVLGWQAASAPTEAEKQKCYEAAEKSGHKAEECKSIWEKTTTDPVAFFTLWLVIFTGGLTFSTLLLWLAGEKQIEFLRESSESQSRDMQASIAAANEANRIARENAIAERRAWLDITDAKLIAPTTFRETDIVLRIQYRIVNLGQSIARNVDAHVEIWCAEASTESFGVVQERLLERARRTPIQLGTQIFPKDDLTTTLLFQEGPDKFFAGIRTRPDGARTFALHIFVTVAYRIEGEITPRITQYVFDLLNAGLPFSIQPSQELKLQPMPFMAAIIE